MQRRTIALLLSYARRYKVRALIAVLNSSLTVIIGAFIGPLIISIIIGQIQAGTASIETSWTLIVWYALTQLYGELIGWRITLYMTWTFETAAQRDMYRDVFDKLSNESLSFHANRFGGSLVSQATKLNGSFERFWDTLIFQATPSLVSLLATVVILWFVLWQYALFILVVSIVFVTVVVFGSRFMYERNTKEAQASTRMNGRLADMVTNVLAVKSHGSEKKELASATKLANKWREASLHSMRGFLGVSSVYSFLTSTVQISAIIAAIMASERGLITVSVAYLIVTYTLTVARQLWEMNNIMRNYNRIMGDAYDMVEILHLPYVVKDHDGTVLSPGSGEIVFDDVVFAHDDDEAQTLFKHFSLNIPSGQKVGLVGHSGSGKTTLTRVLLRFSDISSGSIKIDNQDIANVTQASLRKAIAYVPQEPLLFHRSLRENIAYGRPEATEKQVTRAAKLAHAHEFITKLHDGYETLVGERGVKLSGGQRQRIAIARAILKDAPILVLDEATSALDSESEKLIQASLDDLMKDRTSIVIAHRLSTIAKLDRIIVLEDGKIVEDGSHDELLRKKGTYARLWSHQSGGFIEE